MRHLTNEELTSIVTNLFENSEIESYYLYYDFSPYDDDDLVLPEGLPISIIGCTKYINESIILLASPTEEYVYTNKWGVEVTLDEVLELTTDYIGVKDEN
jgi:hypothetical protein